MGCEMSKKWGDDKDEEDVDVDVDVAWVCRERKRLVKKAVNERLVFAHAHSSYISSLSSLSSAISSFVSPLSPPISNNATTCSHVYQQHQQQPPPPPPPPPKWDFFNVILDDDNCSKPTTLEEEEDTTVTVTVNNNGCDLLQALKEVDHHFLIAHHSGLHISRLLEAPLPLPLPLDNHSTTTKRSISSCSLSSKSLLSSTSRSNSSTWTTESSKCDQNSLLSSSSENSSTWTHHTTTTTADAIDGYWGMVSGTHSFTLGRLYAWEKKLCHEVKTGAHTWKIYQQKCSQLRKKDLEGGDLCPSKSVSEVTDLYHQVLVNIQRAEIISKQIDNLRDQELQPQIIELLQGLMKTWKTMLDSHEIQKTIVYEIRSFNRSDDGKFCCDSHRLATLELEAVIQNWYTCFSNYISAQKAYVKSLHKWLSKFAVEESKNSYKRCNSLQPIRFNGPTLMVISHNWLTSLERLPEKAVKNAMKSLAKDIQALWIQQGEEQKQKRKVDGLSKEMNSKIIAVKRAEDKALVQNCKAYSNVKDQVESLNEKKNQLDKYKKRVQVEKERYLSRLQETQQVTVSRLQMGLSSVFESLADFSRASVNIYSDLLNFSPNAKV